MEQHCTIISWKCHPVASKMPGSGVRANAISYSGIHLENNTGHYSLPFSTMFSTCRTTRSEPNLTHWASYLPSHYPWHMCISMPSDCYTTCTVQHHCYPTYTLASFSVPTFHQPTTPIPHHPRPQPQTPKSAPNMACMWRIMSALFMRTAMHLLMKPHQLIREGTVGAPGGRWPAHTCLMASPVLPSNGSWRYKVAASSRVPVSCGSSGELSSSAQGAVWDS